MSESRDLLTSLHVGSQGKRGWLKYKPLSIYKPAMALIFVELEYTVSSIYSYFRSFVTRGVLNLGHPDFY